MQTCLLIFSLLLFHQQFSLTGSRLIDPLEEMLKMFNPKVPMSTFSCIHFITAISPNIDDVFPSPNPDDPKYAKFGFRAFGETCDYLVDRTFHNDMLTISKYVTSSFANFSTTPDLQISEPFYMRNYSSTWKSWATGPNSLKVCNPRWFLECQQTDTPGVDKCSCFTTVVKSLGITLVRESVSVLECFANGTCPYEHKLGHRCVAKDSYPATDLDTRKHYYLINVCEMRLPPFGICMINCDHDSECTILHPEHLLDDKSKAGEIENKNEDAKFLNRRVCCKKGATCQRKFEKSAAQPVGGIISWWVMASLLYLAI